MAGKTNYWSLWQCKQYHYQRQSKNYVHTK